MSTIASLRRELAHLKAGFARLSGPHVERLQSYRADPANLMVDAGLVPDAWQSEFLRTDIHQALLLSARQVGKSTVTAFLALKEALLNPGSTFDVNIGLAETPSRRPRVGAELACWYGQKPPAWIILSRRRLEERKS